LKKNNKINPTIVLMNICTINEAEQKALIERALAAQKNAVGL
jgi:hypothetical protein